MCMLWFILVLVQWFKFFETTLIIFLEPIKVFQSSFNFCQLPFINCLKENFIHLFIYLFIYWEKITVTHFVLRFLITPPSGRGLVIPFFFPWFFFWWSLAPDLRFSLGQRNTRRVFRYTTKGFYLE